MQAEGSSRFFAPDTYQTGGEEVPRRTDNSCTRLHGTLMNPGVKAVARASAFCFSPLRMLLILL